jgi:hypothetical protein
MVNRTAHRTPAPSANGHGSAGGTKHKPPAKRKADAAPGGCRCARRSAQQAARLQIWERLLDLIDSTAAEVNRIGRDAVACDAAGEVDDVLEHLDRADLYLLTARPRVED